MRHTRSEVIERTIREYERLDALVARLSPADWQRPLHRSETKDPWTVKDALAHITYWKADVARAARRQRRAPEARGLTTEEHNHLVYVRWRERPATEVATWHREVQADVLAALREAPEAWFAGRERNSAWPYDLDSHSAHHRVRDMERALKVGP
ncbi:MAG: maleylpyruvate isomerase N-terminal domain-containing protein [Candidatus Limnocylindrales bacterium]